MNRKSGRYEYPGDRLVFSRWLTGPWHGNKKPYWQHNEFCHTLKMELRYGDKCMAYELNELYLLHVRHGWRRALAQTIRCMRHALRRS